jgi:ATP-binding cassette, subfamily B, bacterial HlyB/CyaB
MTALHCLVAVAKKKGINFPIEQLLSEYHAEQVDKPTLVKAARSIGLDPSLEEVPSEAIPGLGAVFPLICFFRDGSTRILAGTLVSKDLTHLYALIDPTSGSVEELTRARFDESYDGTLLFLKPVSESLLKDEGAFGFRWFLPQIFKQKKAFTQIFIASLGISFVGLGVPIFVQQLIDKVLVHQNMSTLYVLTVAVVLSILFEAAFTFIRSYLTNAATRKIDLSLNRSTFSHLLSLPIDYFESRAAGLITRQVQQIQVVRGFLTGQIFFTVIEAVIFLIFLPILLVYSVPLTLVVLAISVVMALLTYSLVGPFRRRLQAAAAVESGRQAMLVESVHGVRTLKALSLERSHGKNWDDKTATALDLAFSVAQIGNVANSINLVLQRLMIVGIMVVGSFLVIAGEISLGALIGFQMLSSRITGPIAMFVSLIHEYQQIAVSLGMIGDIMDKRGEMYGKQGLRTKLQGKVEFDNVGFRYPSANYRAIDRVNLTIAPGESIGLVGKSGSGKSTIAKLLQGLYIAQEGVIRFDNVDLREYDLNSLRKQVGIVLQDSFLFRGSIRDNFLIALPSATHEQIVAASRLASADEFIEKLPQSYDTLVEESSTNLSGGQRQRIAIARALITNPRILIFDEATSALDPETEAVVMSSLKTIAQNRTVIIISHRLSTLTRCNRIAFLEDGMVLACAPHADLLTICPQYKHLWGQQNYHLSDS